MRFNVAFLTAVIILTCASAWADPPSDESAGSRESAVWAPKLGAHDIQVRGFGCIRLARPEPLPGVRIRMKVLQPAGKQGGQAVPAHWQMVD